MAGQRYSHLALAVSTLFLIANTPLANAQLRNSKAIQSAGDRIQNLIDEGKLTLPDDVTIERIPNDVRDLGVVYNDAHRLSGTIAAVSGAEAIVHKNDNDSGFGFFMNFQPTSGPRFPGAFLADNLGLGNGFKPGDLISSYEVKIHRSSRDPATNLLADVHLELWDGDPLSLVDTGSQGFSNAPIPGSAVTFSGIAVNTVATLRAVLDPPVAAANKVVWLTMTGNACRLGWRVSFKLPTIGPAVADIYEEQRDRSGFGACCDTGEACDVSQGITCADDADGSAQMCSDGDAEGGLIIDFFGGQCTGDPTTDTCATFVNTVRAPAKTTISLVPVGTGPDGALDPGATINGNEIFLLEGDTEVIMEVRVSNFDPDGLGVALKGYITRLDVSSYTSGLAGTLASAIGRHPCTTSADCIPVFGGVCNQVGTPCTTDDDCIFPDSCRSQSFCNEFCGSFGVVGCGTDFCSPAFVVPNRPDFLADTTKTSVLPAVDISTPRMRMGALFIGGADVVAPSPYPAEGLYGGTFVFYVPADAAGTFTVAIEGRPGSFMEVNDTIDQISLLGVVPAKITIQTGRCCVDGGPSATCIDGVIQAECDAIPFSRDFVPGGKCTDAGVQCDRPVRNRYLPISAGDPGVEQAIRVTFTDLPGAFAVLNGTSMWVGAPFSVSENGATASPLPGWDNFLAARLQCDPVFMDWTAVGTVEVAHENIVPDGTYTVEVFDNTDPPTPSATGQPFDLVTGRWGDFSGSFDLATGVWTPPDGSVDIGADVIAVIATYGSVGNFARKVRIDVVPARLDQGIGLDDFVRVIDAFAGKPYPFEPTTAPCPYVQSSASTPNDAMRRHQGDRNRNTVWRSANGDIAETSLSSQDKTSFSE